jgi:hypothetical protein
MKPSPEHDNKEQSCYLHSRAEVEDAGKGLQNLFK